jgi:hemolysin activation/secretion protein
MQNEETALPVQFRIPHSSFCLLILWSATLGAQVLPPPPTPPKQANKLPTETRLFVRGYDFYGNTVFSDAELARVTEPFTDRELSSEELEQARRSVTLHYINHGYINSGAVIPDQDPTNGIIVIRIVEGVLSGIELRGNKWLRDSYLTGRLRRWSTPPLNLNRLQEGLHLLRQNPNVEQINAELKPGTAPGDSTLDLRVQDRQPFRLGLQVDNQRPPSVGAYQIWLLTSDLNLTGHSDPLDFKYGIANAGENGPEFSGADNMEGSYFLPLTRFDTTFGIHFSRLNTSIVEEPFTDLDIESLTTTYGGVLRQPVYQTANQEVSLAVGFDWRKNKSWLLGEPFNISPGAEDGEMVVSVLRLSQEWIQRGQNHVLALRSTFNFGLNVFGATDNGVPGDPNGEFFSWLGQGQYVRRLFNTQNELVMRVMGQWTAEPLLALEQFSVGGFQTVRGYLENQLVRDRGIVSSLEFRLPVLFDKQGAGIVKVAPFFDYGGAWNVNGSPSPTSIYSIGTGLLVEPNKHLSAQLYWGYRLRHVEVPDDSGGQGLGLSFRVNIQAF